MRGKVPAPSRPQTRGRRLPWIVLGLWMGTEATGVHMLLTFVRGGGFHDERLDTTYPAGLVANLTLGSAASVLWMLFLRTRVRTLALAAFGQFSAAIAAGTALAVPWHLAKRTGRPSRRAGGPEALRYHIVVEVAHAILAWATAVLSAIVALRS
jgi:hypothetical protein